MKNKTAFGRHDIGCVLDRSAYSADDLNRDTIALAQEYGFECDMPCASRTEKLVLPSYWASYLVNGDASGLEDNEKEECNAFLKDRNLPDPSDVGESYLAHRNDAGTLPGDVAEFTFVFFGEDNEDYGQELSEAADDAVSFLNELEMPSFCSFYFEDNSLFLAPSLESAKEYVEFISSKDEEYPAEDFAGEWLHVSDHGNATLYVRENSQDTEVWGVV